MRALMQRTWFRALMLALYCICAGVAVFAGSLFRYVLMDGWYSDQEDFGFTQSGLCKRYVEECLSHLNSNLQWLKDPTSPSLGGWGGSAFAYRIVDENGQVMSDTTGGASEFVTSWTVAVADPILRPPTVEEAAKDTFSGAGMTALPTPAPASVSLASETDAGQDGSETEPDRHAPVVIDALEPESIDPQSVIQVPGASGTDEQLYAFTLEGYVNLPVEPYDGCYREYYLFSRLYPLREFFLPVTVVCAVAAAVCMAFGIAAAILCGRRGTLTLLGRVPTDVAVLAWVLAASFLVDQSYEFSELWRVTALLDMSLHEMEEIVVELWGAGVLGCLLANQIAAKVWKEKLLLRRMIQKLSVTVLMLALLCVHGAVVLLCAAFFDHLGERVIFLLLALADAVVLPCVLRRGVEERRVRQASKALAAGDLSYKVDTRHLHSVWKELGQDLNRIGEGMALAVEERMRSERMKTELIANVSHDLKTPLTSIISYIELLKNEDLPEQTRREYLEVLDRQGAKLKKLTEDVVEASKAASGAVKVNSEVFDVRELVEQTAGEYSERLTAAGIETVLHLPEQEALILADPRLLGRVLDNLTVNVLKYAQPGTRAYFDLECGTEQVAIDIKNTSREPLDIPAEELMERFVRADSSRSTEGSGLGLSIARSLSELMGGQLTLILDGDLFKAQVTFPKAALLLEPTAGEAPPPTVEEENKENQV